MGIPTTNLDNTKNAAKQGNAEERPDAAARYTVKSNGVIRCFSNFTGIFERINLGGSGAKPPSAVRLQTCPRNKSKIARKPNPNRAPA